MSVVWGNGFLMVLSCSSQTAAPHQPFLLSKHTHEELMMGHIFYMQKNLIFHRKTRLEAYELEAELWESLSVLSSFWRKAETDVKIPLQTKRITVDVQHIGSYCAAFQLHSLKGQRSAWSQPPECISRPYCCVWRNANGNSSLELMQRIGNSR